MSMGSNDFNEQEIKPLICPLCELGEMEYEFIEKDRPDGREQKGHFWVCNECPGILVEWWDSSDTEAFSRRFK